MRRNLPSISSLRAFEATGRHLSFTRAAIELGITQGAVSQRIAKLEALLGGKLFIRDGNTLHLTSVGSSFLLSARDTIVRLAGATDHAIERERGNTLSIGCLATFAVKRLIPSLNDFRDQHPDLSIRVRSFAPNESPLNIHGVNPAAHEYDVHIQFGSGTWPGMESFKLADEFVFPVCSPALPQRSARLKRPRDLQNHRVILNAYPITGYDYWPLWLEDAGVGGMTFQEEMFFDPLYCAIQAAVDGLGVIMGRSSLVGGDLKNGRLIKPFESRIRTPLSYYVVVPRERVKVDKVEQFCNWARSAFGDSNSS